jgi:glycosyltransferase involved in cell wall biosynthesis
LLAEEERRTGAPQDRPSRWIIAREQREYALADRIVVLSSFARDSFIAEGLPEARLFLLPLGARLDAFRPGPEVVEARRRRILAGRPLRVLYVGALSFQKGLWDLAEVVRRPDVGSFEFRLVGAPALEAAALIGSLAGRATFTPRVPQAQLPSIYAWGDLFVFPTIQDGYAVVLAQAAAAGLPILATTNCAAPDLVRAGESGWIVPIRSPEALVERLHWCDAHRGELATMAERVVTQFQPRDWSDVAADFEALCAASLAQ